MAGQSLQEQLVALANPLPVLDEDEDVHQETRARVEEDAGAEGEDGSSARSRLRRQNAALLQDTDPRYAGRPVSRKQLGAESDGSLESSDLEGGAVQGDGSEEEEEEDDDEQLEAFKARLSATAENLDDVVSSTVEEEEELTHSEEAPDREDPDVQPRGSTGSEVSDTEELEDEDGGSEDEDEDGAADETEGFALTAPTASSDTDKGNAVKAQLAIWDQLLECRIKLQPCLQLANQLPQPASWQQFWPSELSDELRQTRTAAEQLLTQLTSLQLLLLKRYPETEELARTLCDVTEDVTGSQSADDSQEGGVQSRRGGQKRRGCEPLQQLTAKRYRQYSQYRDTTVQRWNDKTRLSGSSAGFAAFQQSTLTQIQHILTDRERLLKRTRLNRAHCQVLGSGPQQQMTSESEGPPEYDSEIFDDGDFYHQLLRELIERKTADVTDPLALGRQWIQIQKLRSRVKKKVDTRASKGRKIRYEVYPKLVNFLASRPGGALSDSARDELFGSLFGARSRPAELNGVP